MPVTDSVSDFNLLRVLQMTKTAYPPLSGSPATQRTADVLRERLRERTARIAVIGLGYVGLPLVHAFHSSGYAVLGYDIDAGKVEMLRRGESYLHHLGDELARNLAGSKRFEPTADAGRLPEADAIVLCVPTPLDERREPDLSFVLGTARVVARQLRPGQLIVLESTTYPGTTRQEVLPILEHTGLHCGLDFFLAYSPEREDPGRPSDARGICRLVAGIDELSGDLAEALYTGPVRNLHRVSSVEVAEAAKLLENIYRAVNVALVNELKVALTGMDIDVWEVIAAASTKPFGYQPFYPGPGLGGHCIPIDPFYLAWKARRLGISTHFIELAGEVNAQMPTYVINRLTRALEDAGSPLATSHILVVGIAYKPNVADVRETPAAEIIHSLQELGARVSYHDPFLPSFPPMRRYQIDLRSLPLTEETVVSHDCVLIVTDHDSVDYELLGRSARLIVDTRNAMARVAEPVARIVKA